jgi:hypothetical protein
VKTPELRKPDRKLLFRQRALASNCRISFWLSLPDVGLQLRPKHSSESEQAQERAIQGKQSNQVVADRISPLHFAVRKYFKVESSVIGERVNETGLAVVAAFRVCGRPLGAFSVVASTPLLRLGARVS